MVIGATRSESREWNSAKLRYNGLPMLPEDGRIIERDSGDGGLWLMAVKRTTTAAAASTRLACRPPPPSDTPVSRCLVGRCIGGRGAVEWL